MTKMQNKTLTNVNKRLTTKQVHNDRNFTAKEDDGHIDSKWTIENIYWNCYDGVYMDMEKSDKMTFEEVERKHYVENYQKSIDETNAKYIASRHKERVKSIDDVLTSSRTAPMEMLVYVGDKNTSVTREELLDIFNEFLNSLNKYENLCPLDIALHVDEKTPHIHFRFIIDYEDEKGVLHINQNKGLEAMGIEPPDPSKKIGKNNNRMQTFTEMMRKSLIEICANHNINIVKADHVGGRPLTEYKAEQEAKERRKQEEAKAEEAIAIRKQEEAKTDEAVKDLEAIEDEKGILEKALDLLRAKYNSLLKSFNKLTNDIKELKDENADLKVENARLKAQNQDYGQFLYGENYVVEPKKKTKDYNIDRTMHEADDILK